MSIVFTKYDYESINIKLILGKIVQIAHFGVDLQHRLATLEVYGLVSSRRRGSRERTADAPAPNGAHFRVIRRYVKSVATRLVTPQ